MPHWRLTPAAPPPRSEPLPRALAPTGHAAPAIVRHLTNGPVGHLELVNRSSPVVNWREIGVDGHWFWGLDNTRTNRLWTITLHYHHWLCELARYGFGDPATSPDAHNDRLAARRLFRSALQSWLDRCPRSTTRHTLAWNSYAIATRMAVSVQASQLISAAEATEPADEELADRWRQSLFAQADHLYQNIEWDLRANHLLRDAVGLAWAGRYFSGPRAERWREEAHRIAVAQAREQLLPDGGHFERSPFYHLEVMDDWLALATLVPEASDLMLNAWERSADFARWMCHPDGKVAQFNDGGRSEAAPHLRKTCPMDVDSNSRLQPVHGGRHFVESGFCAWHAEPWSLFFDVGPVGPDCQPGHAHADTLSVECSLSGKLLFADPGCLDYDLADARRYDRSTAAHNTVCIDGEDSSEMWHIFRVGRRARPYDVSVAFGQSTMHAEAAHDGYRHLPGAPMHHRTVSLDDNGDLRITDRVDGGARHHLSGGWLLAPGWSAQQHGQTWRITHDDGSMAVVELYANQPIEQSQTDAQHRPHYHQDTTVTRLQWQFDGKLPLEVRTVVRPVSWQREQDAAQGACD